MNEWKWAASHADRTDDDDDEGKTTNFCVCITCKRKKIFP